MGTVPYGPPPEPTAADRIEVVAREGFRLIGAVGQRGSSFTRSVVGGDEMAAIRRPLLYLTALAGMWMGWDFWPLGFAGLAAIFLLAITDRLV